MAVHSRLRDFSLGLWAFFPIMSAVGILGLAAVGHSGRLALDRVGRQQAFYSRMLGAFSSLGAVPAGPDGATEGVQGQAPDRAEAARNFQDSLDGFSRVTRAGSAADQALAHVRAAWKAWDGSRPSGLSVWGASPKAYERVRSALKDLAAAMAQVGKAEGARIDRIVLHWSLALAFMAFVGLLAAVLQRRYLEEALVRPLERICTLLGRVNVGATFLRIPVQRNPLLRELGRRCNRVLEHLETAVEEGRRRIQAERVLAAAIAESCAAPLLVLSSAGELLICNARGRDLVAGEDGLDLAAQLKDALREGVTTVAARGIVYRIAASEAAAVRGFAGWVVQLHSSANGNGGDS